MSFAVDPKSKGDEEKVISALRRSAEEDPMMELHRDPQTSETIVGRHGPGARRGHRATA